MEGVLKPVRWIGTSLKDLRSFPRPVRMDIGHALFTAQEGGIDPAAKPLKGFGAPAFSKLSLRTTAMRGGLSIRCVFGM